MSTRRLVSFISFWVLLVGLVIALGPVMSPVANANCDHVVAFTDKGPILGLRTEAMNKFLGIPYAAPPVVDLRWKPPQPVERWYGLRDAT